jgi:hypothetical protein
MRPDGDLEFQAQHLRQMQEVFQLVDKQLAGGDKAHG